jgi:Flp pilus assembly protein TadD
MNEEVVNAMEQSLRLQEDNRVAHLNFIISLDHVGDGRRIAGATERAIPVFERHIRLNPDDLYARVCLATVYSYAGNTMAAMDAADQLAAIETIDAVSVYNLACVYLRCGAPDRGMQLLRRAVEKGFRNIHDLKHDPDLDSIRGRTEFENMMKEIAGDLISPTQIEETH